MLLITGTQRTGSTLLASFLQRCGYEFTGDNDSVGAHDDANISMEYRRILNDPTFPWSNYPSERASFPLPRLRYLDYEMAKWPFLMMDPKLMEIWIQERGGRDKLLILVRGMEHVVLSKKNTSARVRQFSTDSDRLKLSAERLKQNWFDCFMLVLSQRIEHRILKFPEFTRDFESVFDAVSEWGGLPLPPDCVDIWNEVFDEQKITAR
jgi:hypothetical protein